MRLQLYEVHHWLVILHYTPFQRFQRHDTYYPYTLKSHLHTNIQALLSCCATSSTCTPRLTNDVLGQRPSQRHRTAGGSWRSESAPPATVVFLLRNYDCYEERSTLCSVSWSLTDDELCRNKYLRSNPPYPAQPPHSSAPQYSSKGSGDNTRSEKKQARCLVSILPIAIFI
jgi:hypothetical protein